MENALLHPPNHSVTPFAGYQSHSALSHITGGDESPSGHDRPSPSDNPTPTPPPHPPPLSPPDEGEGTQRPHAYKPSQPAVGTDEGGKVVGSAVREMENTGSRLPDPPGLTDLAGASEARKVQRGRLLTSQLHVTVPTAQAAARLSSIDTSRIGSGGTPPQPTMPDISISSDVTTSEDSPQPAVSRGPSSPPTHKDTLPADHGVGPRLGRRTGYPTDGLEIEHAHLEQRMGMAVPATTATERAWGDEVPSVSQSTLLPTRGIPNSTLLKMGRYYNTTMCHYWDMLVK